MTVFEDQEEERGLGTKLLDVHLLNKNLLKIVVGSRSEKREDGAR